MREIDLSTWPRRKAFEFFRAFDQPHFGLCANLELTPFYHHVKASGLSFTIAFTYVISRAANALPEFRCRIRAGKIIEHETVHPSILILVDDDLFSFCTIPYTEDFAAFAERAAARIAHVKAHPTLEDEPDQDDLLYLSALPWIAFTSVSHAMPLHPPDSIPRLTWGKIIQEGATLKIPFSVQAHHALMDGIHIARLCTRIEHDLQHPETVFGSP